MSNTATKTEIGYLSGVSSSIQTQIDSKTAVNALATQTGVRLLEQSSNPLGGSNQGIYSKVDGELYYNDGSNEVKITLSGAVNGSGAGSGSGSFAKTVSSLGADYSLTGSYADTGLSCTFTTAGDNEVVLLDLSATLITTSVATLDNFFISYNIDSGSDVVLFSQSSVVVGSGFSMDASTNEAVSIATAGSHTIKIRAKSTNATGKLNSDATLGKSTLTILQENLGASALTANRALASDGSGVIVPSSTTSTELGYVHNVTSAIQTQLDSKLALAGGTLTGAVNFYRTSTAVSANSSAQTIIGVTDNSAARTITLLTADMVAGRIMVIKDEAGTAGSSNNITIATEGSEKIDGQDTITISVNYGVLRVYNNGVNWFSF